MTTNRSILLVEDNEDDVFLMKRALKGANVVNPLPVVEDGQEAVDYLGGQEAYLTQCVSNLLANAVKFVPAGVVPEILIRSERLGQQSARVVPAHH